MGAATVRFGGRAVLIVATLLLAAGYASLAGIQALWQLSALTVLIGGRQVMEGSMQMSASGRVWKKM